MNAKNNNALNFSFNAEQKHGVDIALLFFLIGGAYSKLYVKLFAAIAYLIYIIWRKYDFKKITRLQVFYFVMIFAGTIPSLINSTFAINGYIQSWLLGTFTWCVGGLISYLLYTGVLNIAKQSVHATAKAFFILNIAVTSIQLGVMIIQSGHLVPYWYWDEFTYYGVSTGDHLFGLFNNVSITNATVSAIGAIYFLFNREFWLSILCVLVLLLCTSNTALILFASIIFIAILLVKKLRRNAILVLVLISFVYPLLTLENIKYLGTVYESSEKKVLTTPPPHRRSQ